MELESGDDSFESHWKLLDDDKTVQCKACNLRLNHGLDQNLLDSHVAWHQRAAKLKSKRSARQQNQAQKNSWKTKNIVSASKAIEIKTPSIEKVMMPEKNITVKVEDVQPDKSSSTQRVKCLTCPLKTTKNRAISVMQPVYGQTFEKIIFLVTGVQASENDIICLNCSKKAMQAFEYRQAARKQVDEKISEEDKSMTKCVKSEYDLDVEFNPKTKTECISDDDHDDKDEFYDDFRFSDNDDEDTPLHSLSKTMKTKPKPNGGSEIIKVLDEKTGCVSIKKETEFKKPIVQTTKINKNNSDLTLKCIQCSKTFNRCLELMHHVRVEHRSTVSISERHKAKLLAMARKRQMDNLALLRSTKAKSEAIKQMYLKKVKASQPVECTVRCGVCYLLFNDEATLETHLREHRDTEAIMCGVCSRVYYKFPHFKRHFSTYHPEETNIIQAEATETLVEIEEEEVRQQLEQYIRTTTIGDLVFANVSPEEENAMRMFAHACGLCGELSLTKEQMEEHKKSVHAAEVGRRCFICGITYGQGSTVALYHSLNCRKRLLPSECVQCGVKLRSPQVLEGHFQLQHSQQFSVWERRYCDKKCNRCGLELYSKDALRYHLKVVCPDKDQVGEFSCDKCSKKFRVKFYLIKHIERVHDRAHDMRVCPVCGKLVRKMNTHMTVHSGEKPYKCKFCPAAFRVSHERTYHQRKHTQDSPYKCDPCNRLFNRPSSHRRHMMQHTGERPHKCNMCEAAFIQKNCLVAHMKKHTPYDESMAAETRVFEEPPPKGAEIEVITEEHSDSELDWAVRKKKFSSYW